MESSTPPGFCRTCWRGMALVHPDDWEPAALSGPKESPKCILVDRRHERLELTWQQIPRQPDLAKMYELRGKAEQAWPTKRLTGVPGWAGLVRTEDDRIVVEAGRYFSQEDCLAQAVLFWRGGRDVQLERTVLTSVAPQGQRKPALWPAAALRAELPAESELTSTATRVRQAA